MASSSEFPASGASLGGIIESFEAALKRDEHPRIADYLPRPDVRAALVELLHVEMEFKLKGGGEASVSEYLSSYPPLHDDRDAVVTLIEAEFKFRSRRDRTLTHASFLSRYPKFASDVPTPPPSEATAEHGPTNERGPRGGSEPVEIGPGLVIAGRYELVSKLGEGGMVEVWIARQTEPVTRDVAIKLVRPDLHSRDVIRRLEQERQALAMIDHPHIAKILDGGLTEGRRPFFVMEWVDGLPLTRFCDEAKLGVPARIELFVSICQTVQHAHQKGIVHRDLKPSNILVAMIDGRPVPKVIDFGLSKAIGGPSADESTFAKSGDVVGTLEYMAPEQTGWEDADVDTRADIYSLGVVLYELLTGSRPFEDRRSRTARLGEMIRTIREDVPSKPSTHLSSEQSSRSLAAVRGSEPARLTRLLRSDLDWVVMKCLEKQRDRRYVTATELARDLQRFLADEPVEARPSSAGYRCRKFVRRNGRAVIGASLVALAAVVGMAGTLWGLIRAERADARATIDRRTAAIKAETAAQLTDYLVRTFQSADPIGLEAAGFHGPGERSEGETARRMLDRGAEIVGEYLHDQPLARASLLDAMGNSYRNLGDWDSARARLEDGYRLRQSHLGKDAPETIDSLQSLAHLARDRGDYPEADRIYRDVIARREGVFTADHLLVAETKTYLAWMTFHRPLSLDGPQFNPTRLDEAERLLLDALRVREARLRANHRDIGITLAGLASVAIGRPKGELAAIG